MKRAWMPISLVGAVCIGQIGCGPGDSQMTWFRSGGRSSTQPSDNSVARAPAPQPATQVNSAATRPAGETDPALESVQAYVARFPTDDRDRARTASASPAQPASPPRGEPPPPRVIYTTDPQRANDPHAIASAWSGPVRSTPPTTAPATTAMAPIQLPPPAPARTEATQQTVAASPVSQGVLAPAPSLAVEPKAEILEVRAAGPAPSATTQPANSGANQAVTGSKTVAAKDVDALIADLEARVKLHPQQVDDQFRLRLLYAATGQDERAVGAIDGVDAVQGELMMATLRAVIAARKSMQDPSASSGQAIAAAEELRRLVAQQSSVVVPRVALVTRVNSFGDYEAVSPPKFPAGQPVHVFLYTEVKNFRSEAAADNRLRTVLAEKVEIFDASGKVIWQRGEPSIEDRALSPRNDFFMTMEIELPSDTPAGEYVLKVTVEDKLGATTDQQRLNFTIESK